MEGWEGGGVRERERERERGAVYLLHGEDFSVTAGVPYCTYRLVLRSPSNQVGSKSFGESHALP